MDKYKEKCDSIGLKYKQKYDKLLSLVNGYENQNINVSKEQQKNMQQLYEIISNTKELLSESEFTSLRNEQDNMMKEFYHLENVKNDNPYSNNALEFTNNSTIVEESLNETENKTEETKTETTIEKIKNFFTLDSFKNIDKKTNNVTEEVKEDLERNDKKNDNSTETQTSIQEKRNDILQNPPKSYPITHQQIVPTTPQPCYPNKPNFVGLPSIQIVNVESGCHSKRKSLTKHRKNKKTKINKKREIKQVTRVPSKKRKPKKDGPKCHKDKYVPTFKDKSNNHKIF